MSATAVDSRLAIRRRARALDGGSPRSLSSAWYLVHTGELGNADRFEKHVRSRWADVDLDRRMRPSAFAGYCQQLRGDFLEARGVAAVELAARGVALLAVEDRLDYRLPIGPLESFRIDLELAAFSEDGVEMLLRSRFVREADNALFAVAEARVRWYRLAEQRPYKPSVDLRDLWLGLPCSDDFQAW